MVTNTVATCWSTITSTNLSKVILELGWLGSKKTSGALFANISRVCKKTRDNQLSQNTKIFYILACNGILQ